MSARSDDSGVVRPFVCRENVRSASELLDSETASFGKAGSFRAPAIARRYMNTSRRNLGLKTTVDVIREVVGLSEVSGLTRDSNLLSEQTPLKATGDEERATSDSLIVAPVTTCYYSNFLEIWVGKPISILLLFAPFATASHYLEWGPQWIFWLNFLTMVPLASILGDFTEEAALHTSDVVGGLLNASFGNAVEVVVAIQALLNNEIRVVQSSMIGSIFSNLLLVLGMCFFFGGLTRKEQYFSSLQAMSGMGLLALSSIAMILPTPFAAYWEIEDESVLTISRVAASFLLVSYLQLLLFQLYTHKDSFTGGGNDDGDEEEEKPSVPMWMALLGLGLTTASVTVYSDYLVESIDGFCTESGISRTFVGLIILPIVGNAVEHITAVSVAMKNKMDLALGVAIGSSTQIALFVVPVTVLWGWFANKPMTLNFPMYEISLYVLSIFTVSVCLGTGKSNWLLGSILITTYIMLAIGFWFEKVEEF